MTKIEAGKYYRDRQGLIWGPIRPSGLAGRYQWTAPNVAGDESPPPIWTEDGHFFASRSHSERDLVAEVPMTPADEPSPRLKITDIEDHGPVGGIETNGDWPYTEAKLSVEVDEGAVKSFSDFLYRDDKAAEPRVKPGFDPLADVLQLALNQAQSGKGSLRHTDKPLPWLDQPILEISRMVGAGGPAFQVMKKTQEACRMAQRGQYSAAVAELLGAINYAAAAVILIREIETESGRFDEVAQAAE